MLFTTMIDRLEVDKRRAEAFNRAYEHQRTVVDDGSRQIYTAVGRSYISRRMCRYCMKSDGENRDGKLVTFRKEAHLIPQLLGNKYLLMDFECDICNEESSAYENELGAYTAPIRTLLGVVGQRGLPTYKMIFPGGDQLRIEHKDGRVQIQAPVGTELIDINEDRRTFTLTTPRPRFIPLGVYKSLVKIAYALMDEDELLDFSVIRTLLRTKDLDARVSGHQLFSMVGYSVPGGLPGAPATAQLWRRRVGENVPAKVLTVTWANQFWQVPILSTSDNVAAGRAGVAVTQTMPKHPAPVGRSFVETMGAYQEFTQDLSIDQPVLRDEFSTTFRYDAVIPLGSSNMPDE